MLSVIADILYMSQKTQDIELVLALLIPVIVSNTPIQIDPIRYYISVALEHFHLFTYLQTISLEPWVLNLR